MHYDGVACREVAAIREATCVATQHRSSGSEERREHQREVHRQRFRLIRN